MRNFFAILSFVVLVAGTARAADDFGARFGATAPPALGPTAIEEAQAFAESRALQDIAPAAGAGQSEEIAGPFLPEAAARNVTTDDFLDVVPAKPPASTPDGYERDLENTTN